MIEIAEVDPFDDDTFDQWHAAYWAAQRHGLDDDAVTWTLPELRVAMQEPNRRLWNRGYVARLDGEVVGTGYVATPLLDNLDHAEVVVDVRPEHRRRGIGTRLYQHLEGVVRERGRTVLDAEVTWPHAAGSDGGDWAGARFAAACGFTLSLGDVQREARLPIDDGLLAELAAEAAPHHAAYTVRSWTGPIPDEIAESWMTLSSSLMTEAPTGDKELEPEVVDVAALREGEATVAKQGRIRYNAVALDAAGEVAAYTDLVTTPHEPGRCYQWGTLVRKADRGHRLGLAVKVANLQLLQREAPDARRLTTWNAEVNAHMIEINERLGFRPTARLGEYQKRLD